MPILVTNDFPPAIGGIQRYMDRLAHTLSDSGYGTCVVAPGPGDDSGFPFPVERFSPEGRLGRLVEMDRALDRATRRSSDGVTIASSWNPAGIVGARRRRSDGEALCIIAHGSEIFRQETLLRRTAMRLVFDRADVVFCISRYTSKQLRLAGIKKQPILLPGGVDAWTRRRPHAERPTVLSVGRLVRRKGFDRVIEALPKLRRIHPDVVYEIAGEGPDRDYLFGLAQRLGVAGCVRFLGRIDDRALRAAYERAWCFALPVRRDGHEVEGFGLVYLEAAMAGLPSIGGRHSGAEDAVEHGKTGLLVDGNDAREIRDALEVLLRDRDFAALLGNAARARALRDFSWRGVAQTIALHAGLRAPAFHEARTRLTLERPPSTAATV